MNEVPTRLSDMMFVVTLLMATGALKALLASTTQYTDPMFKIVITQRIRYQILLIATIVSFVPTYVLIEIYGFDMWQAAAAEWKSMGSAIGYVVWALNWIALVTPLLALILAFNVYLRPAPLARRVFRGGYASTYDVRHKTVMLPVYPNQTVALAHLNMRMRGSEDVESSVRGVVTAIS